ncbi:MAG TPA: D-2-hydroxyacid dehydrogenase [Gaiellaceae bacterium]|nr:D-2-hydroxyacid dehydrogenase [Gaiellaceae bacterium]
MKVLLMYPPSPEHEGALREAAPSASFVAAADERSAARLIRNADVVLGNRFFLQSLPEAKRLRWMQSNSAGVDRILSVGPALEGIVLTNARGVYDDEVADHAVALVLALARGVHLARDAQRERRWERMQLATLRGRRAVVLGWGGIGRGIAHRLRAFGVVVEGVRRRGPAGTDAEGFLVHAGDGWQARLPQTDILVLALPLTSETRDLVATRELAALPPHVRVVNVGRAQTLDEEALFAALRSGSVAGAALDVVRDEPAPPHHPAWDAPNLLLTPHVARSREKPPYRWEPLFVENVRRFAADEPLVNVVDVHAGY